MTETFLTVEQLDELVKYGVVYKDASDCYYILIDKDRWGSACMPWNMVRDFAGTAHDMTVDPHNQGYYGSSTVHWSICAWMLLKNFDTLKRCGKFIPEPWSDGEYTLRIMSKAHLEDLLNKDILDKIEYGGGKDYAYCVKMEGVGDNSMPDAMVEQVAGKMMHCYKPGDSVWVEEETEHRWSISEWMLEENYEYLKSRALGEWKFPDDDEEFPDDDEEEEEEEEEEQSDWVEATVVGTIIETNPEYITIDCQELSVPVLCYGDAEGYTIDSHVKVRGNLRRVHNMMGYPEIDIKYIYEE